MSHKIIILILATLTIENGWPYQDSIQHTLDKFSSNRRTKISIYWAPVGAKNSYIKSWFRDPLTILGHRRLGQRWCRRQWTSRYPGWLRWWPASSSSIISLSPWLSWVSLLLSFLTTLSWMRKRRRLSSSRLEKSRLRSKRSFPSDWEYLKSFLSDLWWQNWTRPLQTMWSRKSERVSCRSSFTRQMNSLLVIALSLGCSHPLRIPTWG